MHHDVDLAALLPALAGKLLGCRNERFPAPAALVFSSISWHSSTPRHVGFVRQARR
jgi:hypothetical protein